MLFPTYYDLEILSSYEYLMENRARKNGYDEVFLRNKRYLDLHFEGGLNYLMVNSA
jgi:hypothetical protein